mmetsp:Transcript_6057/g.9008  ORF Transcript_6057/g.9008 Transcript_6057/m.9008 type:complete len:96 (-) Transcript_6057:480-767(-)
MCLNQSKKLAFTIPKIHIFFVYLTLVQKEDQVEPPADDAAAADDAHDNPAEHKTASSIPPASHTTIVPCVDVASVNATVLILLALIFHKDFEVML